jgi:hypothetical protein
MAMVTIFEFLKTTGDEVKQLVVNKSRSRGRGRDDKYRRRGLSTNFRSNRPSCSTPARQKFNRKN